MLYKDPQNRTVLRNFIKNCPILFSFFQYHSNGYFKFQNKLFFNDFCLYLNIVRYWQCNVSSTIVRYLLILSDFVKYQQILLNIVTVCPTFFVSNLLWYCKMISIIFKCLSKYPNFKISNLTYIKSLVKFELSFVQKALISSLSKLSIKSFNIFLKRCMQFAIWYMRLSDKN